MTTGQQDNGAASTATATTDEGRASWLPEGLKQRWFLEAGQQFRLTRFVLLRALGAVYLLCFSIVLMQWLPLLGEHGLMPVSVYLERVLQNSPSASTAYWQVPSLFWFDASDSFAMLLAWCGWGVAWLVTLGWANAPLMAVLWVLYGTFVHTGQTFYSFGWEILVLEAGFLGIFLVPTLALRRTPNNVPPLPVIWLYRWLTFRVMFGAGLIKIRGDSCWKDLTCLQYHYETQPNPHPLSWLIHQAPEWFHSGGVLFNHFVELVVPFFLFGPRRVRHIAGGLTILFQLTIILSGNLAFLNWLTIAVALACFDDTLYRKLLPKALVERLTATPAGPLPHGAKVATVGLFAVICVLSLNPIANMLGPRQRMNASFDALNLVNTYGAFGSVGKTRHEVIIEATNADPNDPNARWQEYQFPCKPGDPERVPCLITPYHYRLDWQLWFAGFSSAERQPWLVHLVYKLLQGDQTVARLLAYNPFPDTPPAYVRATLYRYEFTTFGQRGWWRRERERAYLPALSLHDPRLENFLKRRGWLP